MSGSPARVGIVAVRAVVCEVVVACRGAAASAGLCPVIGAEVAPRVCQGDGLLDRFVISWPIAFDVWIVAVHSSGCSKGVAVVGAVKG